jgi:hypothetical protein
MERRATVFWALLFALGFISHPAHAGDRKTSQHPAEARQDLLSPAKNRTLVVRYEKVNASSAANSFEERRYLIFADNPARHVSETENGAESRHEHKPLTLFQFNSKLGKVAVEPVVGHVNGAQFSIGF